MFHQCGVQRVQRRPGLGRAVSQRPTQLAAAFVEHGLQQLQAGSVGEVQVVQRHRLQRGLLRQQRLHGALQRQALALGGGQRTGGPFGQYTCDLAPRGRRQQLLAAVGDGAQQSRQRGQRHAGVAWARRHVQRHAAARRAHRQQVLQQARLAHAGLTDQGHHLVAGPGRLHGLGLDLPPHQARRPQHTGRHQRGRHRLHFSRGAVDHPGQRQRLGAGPHAQGLVQHLGAARKGLARGGAVALQVVQAHDEAVRLFELRLVVEPLQRQRQRALEVARLFGGLQLRRARLALPLQPTLALQRKPEVELGADVQWLCAEQGVGFFEIVAQASGQRQRAAATDQFDPGLLAQLKQALAQRVARRVVVVVGPQQPGQARARGRALDRQPGQQRGVARRQAMDPAFSALKLRAGGQAQLHGGGQVGAGDGMLDPHPASPPALRAHTRGAAA